MIALMLRLDVVRRMKGVLAGTATKRFQDVMEAAFGGEQPAEVHQAFEGDDEEEEEEDTQEKEDQPSTSTQSTSTSTLSAAMKRKLPPTDSGSVAKCKGSHSVKGGVCSL